MGEGSEPFFVSAASVLPSVWNNPYAKAAYVGVVSTATLKGNVLNYNN